MQFLDHEQGGVGLIRQIDQYPGMERSGCHDRPLPPLIQDDHRARMAVRVLRLMAPAIRDGSKTISPEFPNIRGAHLARSGNSDRLRKLIGNITCATALGAAARTG